MKQVTTNNRTLLFVEVPEDAIEITLTELGRLDYMTNGGMDYTMLPSGNYRFIATTDTIPADLGITDTLLAEHSITGRHAIIEVL